MSNQFLSSPLNSHPIRPTDLPADYRLRYIEAQNTSSSTTNLFASRASDESRTVQSNGLSSNNHSTNVTVSWENDCTLRISFSPAAPAQFQLSGTFDNMSFCLDVDKNDKSPIQTSWRKDSTTFQGSFRPSLHPGETNNSFFELSGPVPVSFTDSDPEEIAKEIGKRPTAPFRPSDSLRQHHLFSALCPRPSISSETVQKARNRLDRVMSFEKGDEVDFSLHANRFDLIKSRKSSAASSIFTSASTGVLVNKPHIEARRVPEIVSRLESLDQTSKQKHYTDPTSLLGSSSLRTESNVKNARYLSAPSKFDNDRPPRIFLSPPQDPNSYERSSPHKHIHPEILGAGPIGTYGTLPKSSKCIFNPDSKACPRTDDGFKFHRLNNSPNLRVDRTWEDRQLLGPGTWHSNPSPRTTLPPPSIHSKRPYIRPIQRIQGYPLGFPASSMESWRLDYYSLDFHELGPRPRLSRPNRRRANTQLSITSDPSDNESLDFESSHSIIHLGNLANNDSADRLSAPSLGTPFRRILHIAKAKLNSNIRLQTDHSITDPDQVKDHVYADALALARSRSLQKKLRTAECQVKTRGLMSKVKTLLNKIRRVKSFPGPFDITQSDRFSTASCVSGITSSALGCQNLPHRADSLTCRLRNAIKRNSKPSSNLHDVIGNRISENLSNITPAIEPDVVYYSKKDPNSIPFDGLSRFNRPLSYKSRQSLYGKRKFSPPVLFQRTSGQWVKTKVQKISMYGRFTKMMFRRYGKMTSGCKY